MGGIEYKTTPTVSLSLESIFHAEGRVFNTNTGTTGEDVLRYEYAIRDHLGNTRLTFTDKNNNGKVDLITGVNNEVIQENHYYPFGMAMNGPWMNDAAIDNKYQYNGKEINEDFGIGLYDYGARWYDAAVGRWWGVDPLSAKYAKLSPFNYGVNNPIRFIDPNGMSVQGDFYAARGGKIQKVGSDGVNDGKLYLVKDVSKFVEHKNELNSENTTKMLNEGTVKEISVRTPDGSEEGEYLEALYKKGDSTDPKKIVEQIAEIVFDSDKAEVSYFTGSTKYSGSHISLRADEKVATGNNPNKFVIGSVHTHQAADFANPETRLASSQSAGDGQTAAISGDVIYSIDSQHVDKHVPAQGFTGPTSIPFDNIATTQSLFNCNFSIAKDAIISIAK